MAKQAISAPLKIILPPGIAPSTKWHAALSDFFQSVGLLETLRGFEADLLVLSRAQHEKLPQALSKLGDEVGFMSCSC
jgi:hypothetical protein